MTAGRRTARLSAALLLCLAAACGSGAGPSGPAAEKSRIAPSRPSPAAAGGSVFPAHAGLSIGPPGPDVRSGAAAALAGFPPSAKPDILGIRWFVNGNEIGGGGLRLEGKFLRRGDVVAARAQVRYGREIRVLTAPAATIRNTLPEIRVAALSPLAPRVGDTVRVEATAHDPDGDAVSFRVRWFANDNEIVGETASELSLKRAGAKKGTWIHAAVHVFDGAGQGTTLYTPKVLVVNSPPVVARIAITPGAGNRFAATVTATDADGDPVTIAAASTPPGVEISGNVLSWDASAVARGGETPVVLRVSDGDGGDGEFVFRLSSSRSR